MRGKPNAYWSCCILVFGSSCVFFTPVLPPSQGVILGPTTTFQAPTLVAGIGLPGAPSGAVWQAPIQEIPFTGLPDIAMATVDQFGNPVIYYNPAVVQQAGPYLAEFFRAHEYGHINLGHLQSGYVYATSAIQRESEADCYAAQILSTTNPYALQVAYQYFYAQGYAQVPDHPSGIERANIIANCGGG